MKTKKFNDSMTTLTNISPHIEAIGESVNKISKILKIKKKWMLLDMYFKSDGKKYLIDEFRIRRV